MFSVQRLESTLVMRILHNEKNRLSPKTKEFFIFKDNWGISTISKTTCHLLVGRSCFTSLIYLALHKPSEAQVRLVNKRLPDFLCRHGNGFQICYCVRSSSNVFSSCWRYIYARRFSYGDGDGRGCKLAESHDEFVLHSNIDFQHQGTWWWICISGGCEKLFGAFARNHYSWKKISRNFITL